jgi:hypothetical protein
VLRRSNTKDTQNEMRIRVASHVTMLVWIHRQDIGCLDIGMNRSIPATMRSSIRISAVEAIVTKAKGICRLKKNMPDQSSVAGVACTADKVVGISLCVAPESALSYRDAC